MQTFVGECVGGPEAGKKMAHWSKTKTYYRPMVNACVANIEAAPIESVEIGTYHLNDFGQWHWHETESGRAMRTLFDDKP